MRFIRVLKRKKRLVQALAIVLIVLSPFAIILQIANKNLTPMLLSMAGVKAQAMAVDAIHQAVADTMGSTVYKDLITIMQDNEGNITMVQANTLLMNRLAASMALSAQENLKKLEHDQISVPLGSAMGNALFEGWGPMISFKAIPTGSVSMEFLTEFESAGINQTRHKIYVRAHSLIRLVVPTSAQPVSVTAQVLIAESIIVGRVPDSYIEIHDLNSPMLDLLPKN